MTIIIFATVLILYLSISTYGIYQIVKEIKGGVSDFVAFYLVNIGLGFMLGFIWSFLSNKFFFKTLNKTF